MKRNALGLLTEAFPTVVLGSSGACVLYAVASGSLWPIAAAIVLIYLVPPLLHRLHDRFVPVEPGIYKVVGTDYLPWWGSHQLQRIYIAFPSLEAALRVIPGVYSAWLRLWGASVGRGVVWTPRVEILDRPLLEVGDNAVFGHCCSMTSHVITWRKGELRLFVAPIRIGAGALVGAQSGIGPGAIIRPGATVGVRQSVQIREVVE